MQFVYQHPDYCQRLILISSGGLGPDVGWTLRLLSAPGAELVLPIIAPPAGAGRRRAACGSWFGKPGIRSPRGAEMWSAYRSLSDAGDPAGVPAHAALGGRLPGPGRERTEPAARSGRLCRSMVDVGRPGRDHPGRARRCRPGGAARRPARGADRCRATSRRWSGPTAVVELIEDFICQPPPPRTSSSPPPRRDRAPPTASRPRRSRRLATVTPDGPPARGADRVRPRRPRPPCTRRWTGKPKVRRAAAAGGQHRGSTRGRPHLGGPLPTTTGHSCGGCGPTALATSAATTGPSMRPGSASCCGRSIPQHQ